MGGQKVGDNGGQMVGRPIAGYAGFVSGVKAQGLFSHNFASTFEAAATLPPPEQKSNPKFDGMEHLAQAMKGLPPSDKAPYPPNLLDPNKKIAKYGGFMPGVTAGNLYSKTSSDIQEAVPTRNVLSTLSTPSATETPWWAPVKSAEPDLTSNKVGYCGFVRHVESQNIHGSTFAEAQKAASTCLDGAFDPDLTQKMRQLGDADLGERPTPEDHSGDKHVPGYGGFVPGVYSRNVFGATFEQAQLQSESADAHTESQRQSPRRTSSQSTRDITELANPDTKPAVPESAARISGYSGFVANISSKNVCGANWATAQANARNLPDHTIRTAPRTGNSSLAENVTKPASRPLRGATQKLPGYAGYVPKIYARNVYAGTFEVCQEAAHSSA